MRSWLLCLAGLVLFLPFHGPSPQTAAFAEGKADPKPKSLREPGFVFVELYTQDTAGYLKFIESVAGFKVVQNDPKFAVLRSERGEILLNGEKEPANPFRGKLTGRGQGIGVEIGIVAADLDKCHEAAKKSGWTISAGIQKRPWGVRDFRVLAPDGYYLRFTEAPK
jgi:lactoylglutathione lyase